MRASTDRPGVSYSRGFTLIEVLIVVIILGVLMAVALPAYQDSLQKGRRADAKETLMELANRQEAFMLDRSTYTTDLGALNFAATSEEGFYTIDVDPCADGTIASCYELTATPVAGEAQASDTDCGSFILGSDGSKTNSTGNNDVCW